MAEPSPQRIQFFAEAAVSEIGSSAYNRRPAAILRRALLLATTYQDQAQVGASAESYHRDVESSRPESLLFEQARVYLAGLVRDKRIDAGMPTSVLATIDWVRRINPSLPIPDFGPTHSGRVVITWDKGGRHLEAEVLRNGDVELFFRDRDKHYIWTEDVVPTAIGPEQVQGLRLATGAFLAG